ncbi:hypothetical protein IFT47_23625 [Pseudomonas sp. CFBP 13711]|uniref:hypothetical protein n=1 Tax=unclassified Pseudomonas TaxID=196821 RepID=UPI00177F0705|nr:MULTISPECIES: hypothetical protein [unclassified Pseudomonas]MBD8709626.1 hypothetical protein [Pseudomonas sp. CFBP 13711]MBD8714662.1 hypothetical protein [Pseudomonas sp. CFBP 13715]
MSVSLVTEQHALLLGRWSDGPFLGLLLGDFNDLGSGQLRIHALAPGLLHVERLRLNDARCVGMTDGHRLGHRLDHCAFPLEILHCGLPT